MTLSETLTLLTSLLALVVSTVSLVRGRKLGQIQEDLAKISAELAQRQIESYDFAKKAQDAPKVGVHITEMGGSDYFVLTNTGQGSAFNLDLELIDCLENPLATADDLLPYPELKFRSVIKLIAGFHMGSPMRYQVKLTWNYAAGEPGSEVFWVSRG